ncbi:helix-turn-helix transcriptional regulator [Ligilactobacillus salivarius]|uniref:helix-turn-helix domain-containing protein n=1 Tax=Ligilactobacillus salivarius TaxID=1624 RepID=UPI0025A36CEE|nr:helix-turn-helix transcriptional regulator [Ligilactobacillus salivarius]MDM8204978.1 helix-turn-helix transcriptional regulator [Ligilactobacillus salivarius]
MIRYNLNKLLGERNLKISKVFVDTGISRSTLTKIVNNQSSMVQTETIDKLCQYLKVDVKDFFEYIPLDVKINVVPNVIETSGRDKNNPLLDIDIFVDFRDTLNDRVDKFELWLCSDKIYANIFKKSNTNNIFDGIEQSPFDNDYVLLNLYLPDELIEYISKVTNNNYGFTLDIRSMIEEHIEKCLEKNHVTFANVLIDNLGF